MAIIITAKNIAQLLQRCANRRRYEKNNQRAANRMRIWRSLGRVDCLGGWVMSEKFTKGPWQFENWHIETELTGFRVCSFQMMEDVDKANAHLIAAAPEMYDLLEKISIAMECFHGVDTDEINKLLAKARGEA